MNVSSSRAPGGGQMFAFNHGQADQENQIWAQATHPPIAQPDSA
jgi:hypothetical protein